MRRIILVDDPPFVARKLSDKIAQIDGVDVRAVSSGSECLTLIESFPPDLILWNLDIGPADVIVSEVQDVMDHVETEVIYVSSKYDRQLLERARETRPMNILFRPFSDQQLLIWVELALDRLEPKYVTPSRALGQG